MKKIMMILVVLVQITLFAQSTQIIEKPLKLTNVAVGTLSDNVLLIGATDQQVKKISTSSFLLTSGNQTKTGTLNMTNPIGGGTRIALINNENSQQGSLYITNNGAALSSGLSLFNYSSGFGQFMGNLTNGTALQINNSLNATGKILGVSKNGSADVLFINDNGSITANSFIKTGGTALQFLKANGTIDNTLYASLASPVFTGTPTLPTGTIATTQTAGNNTTAIATTAFVAGEIGAGNTDSVTKSTVQTITANKTFSGSTAFNGTAIFGQLIRFSNQTLLASNTVYTSGAIGTVDGHFSFASDNKFPASFSTELVTISIKPILKVPNKSGILATTDDFLNYAPLASPTFTGTPTLPTGTIATTQAAGNNTTAIATTAFVTTAGNLKANLVSPIFTGTPTLPTGTIASTQTAGNNTTAIATTAFVTTAASNFVGLTGNQSITGLKTFAGITYFSSYIGLLNTDSLNSSTTYGSGTIGTIAGNFAIASANKVAGSIATDNVTAFTNPVLQFPNASGTIALTSNLTAYAPLASPTFTGNTKAVAFSLSALNTAPATATATGTLGEIRFTPTGIFICTATNTWIKCLGATF